MPNRIVILTYHQVGEFPPSPRRHLYCHHERFASQMAYLAARNYRVLSMDEMVACLAGERVVPSRAVALTFDDGYENFYEYAYPVLARHRFPAMVYVVSGLVGQRATWYDAAVGAAPELMGRERLLEIKRAGIDIGAHGVSHVRLTDVDSARARDELGRAKADLEQLLGAPVRHYCYAYGAHNPAVVDLARAAGYASAVTLVRAAATSAHDLLALPRREIAYQNGPLGFIWKLRS